MSRQYEAVYIFDSTLEDAAIQDKIARHHALLQTTEEIKVEDSDVEAEIFVTYMNKGVFTISPFETIDQLGIGRLVRMGAEEGRATKPGLKLGVCGEHGGDPESIHFFHQVGLDYVSCSPFRVPVARLEAGRSAVLG